MYSECWEEKAAAKALKKALKVVRIPLSQSVAGCMLRIIVFLDDDGYCDVRARIQSTKKGFSPGDSSCSFLFRSAK